MTMRHVGVDGCKAGWLAVTRKGAGLEHRVFPHIRELVNGFRDAQRILVDIPIGLPWPGVPVRPCDQLARRLLGNPRRSSVFPVPCREALAACSLQEARAINTARIGKSVSEQTWGISPKIAQVDRFLLADNVRRLLVREIHPEVCFWALAGRRPMQHKKKTEEGLEERLAVLRHHEPCIASFLDYVLRDTLREEVQADDVLDATVAFVTSEARDGELASLVGDPSHDLAGLPMEMVYLKTWEVA
jgi:predicted RNase H-like nuclease